MTCEISAVGRPLRAPGSERQVFDQESRPQRALDRGAVLGVQAEGMRSLAVVVRRSHLHPRRPGEGLGLGDAVERDERVELRRVGRCRGASALSMSSGEYWQPDIATAAETEESY